MTSSIQDTLDIGFSRVNRQLDELLEVSALHTAKFASIKCKMEAGFQEVKGEIAALKSQLEALIVERLPKT